MRCERGLLWGGMSVGQGMGGVEMVLCMWCCDCVCISSELGARNEVNLGSSSLVRSHRAS